MNKHNHFLLCLLTFFALHQLNAQEGVIYGIVLDAENNDPLIGASVLQAGSSNGTITDIDGYYEFSLPAGEHTIQFSYTGYESEEREIEIRDGQRLEVDWRLSEMATILQTATVTSGRYEKPLGEVTVSLEVLKPSLLENTNQSSIDGALEKLPGVNVVDGQPSIRGGSGYSYGAGSRVLLLIDDIPILQSDAGLPNWDDVPIENIEQIEVVKGAASALYGSAAMNGIINVRTGFARAEPETHLATFGRTYMAPSNPLTHWWKDEDATPYEFGASLRHARQIGNLDLVLSGYYYNQTSYERTNYDKYGRFTTSLRYRFTDRISFQVNANYNQGSGRTFFFWGGLDELQYRGANGTASITRPIRYNIDPSLTIYTANGDRHRLLGRFYGVNNRNNANRSNTSDLYYGEYQFQKRWEEANLVLTAGAVGQTARTEAELYGDTIYRSRNFSGYLQVEKKFFDRLNISAGARWEHNTLISPSLVLGEIIPNGRTTESRPVFRFGANYQIGQQTFLRGSWGQGYRYPTIAEKFITTEFGGVLISPNPSLESETGWSTELGIKHGFQIGSFGAFVDFAGFWSEYQRMMEFGFEDLFRIGFQSLNVGDTRIRGLEFSFGGQGRLFGGTTNIISGITLLDPTFKEWDTNIPPIGEPRTQGQRNAELSTSTENILKYRNRTSAKLDIETTWGKFSLGLSGIYNSRVENIDAIFELFVVPELAEWRQDESGYLLAGARTAYRFTDGFKVSFLIDNLLNQAYATRPGLLAAPRSASLRLDLKF